MAKISVGFGTDLSLKATIKGIRIAIGMVNEDRINSPVKRKVRQSRVEKDRAVRGAADIKEFIALLGEPHAVMMLVPVGAPVNSIIQNLLPHLEKGDLLITLMLANATSKTQECGPAI
jgi:6-phosphogluconate dehydrogenase